MSTSFLRSGALVLAATVTLLGPGCSQSSSSGEASGGATGGSASGSTSGGRSGSGGTSSASGGNPGSGGTGQSSGGDSGSGGASAGGSGGSDASGGAAGGSGGATGSGGDGASDAAGAGPDAPSATVGDGGVPGLGGEPRACKFQLCESFEGEEGAAPNPAIWSRSNDGLVLSSKYAARGTKSLHVPPMNSGQYFIRESKTFPAMNGAFYGRFYLWIERVPVEKPAGLYHWTFLEGSDTDTPTNGWVIRLGGHHRSNGASYVRFNINTHTPEGEDGLFDMVHGFQAKQWYCIEFYFNTPNSEARFWINGAENPMLHWMKNKAGAYTFPTLKTLRFGWAEYQATNTPYESYIDEIAIDPNRIGCDQ
jgi:hypothetical protein